MAWYDNNGLTYPTKGGVDLTGSILESINHAMDPAQTKHTSTLSRDVITKVVKRESMVRAFQQCITAAAVGSPGHEIMAKYWKRFVSLLAHARFRLFLSMLQSKAQGDLRPALNTVP